MQQSQKLVIIIIIIKVAGYKQTDFSFLLDSSWPKRKKLSV